MTTVTGATVTATTMSRRDVLRGVGGGIALPLGLIGGLNAIASDAAADADAWRYTPIDPAKAARRTYDIYSGGACMYAVFRSLVTCIADAWEPLEPEIATRLNAFPFFMMGYGHGGVGAIGTTCGAFNGAAAALGLFVRDTARRDALIQEVFLYYEKTPLPIFTPPNAAEQDKPMVQVVPGSVLCHVSSSRWRAVADVPMFGPRRADRCKRLSADIAAKTAELLNRYHSDAACPVAALTAPAATCIACHGPKGEQANVIGKATCTECHNVGEDHPKTKPSP